MYRILLSFIALFLASQLAAQNLEWIGDPSDFLPPADITIQYKDSNCTQEFDMFPVNGMCMWAGVPVGGNLLDAWGWELLENVHWQGGCEVEVVYSHVPCSDALEARQTAGQNPLPELVAAQANSILSTEVCITLIDNCDGSQLQYCWNVIVQCENCLRPDKIYCGTCEEAAVPFAEGGCKLCDPIALANGLESCTPPCTDPSCPRLPVPSQPALLCGQQGFVPHNMTWFAFVASSKSSTIRILEYNCIGLGLETGIYPSCNFDEPCVGYDINCALSDVIEYEATFNIGQTYYMFVDGCNGVECDFVVIIEDLSEMVPDDIDYLTAYSPSQESMLTEDFSRGQENASVSGYCDAADVIYTCPGEPIQFGARHQGNVGDFLDNDRPCDEYALLDGIFQWSSSWGETWDYNPLEENTGYFIPEVRVPEDLGSYTLCLDYIDFECYPVQGPKCLRIEVISGINKLYYEDADNDGYGSGDPVLMTCPVPEGFTCQPGDCDDTDASIGVVTPSPEINIDCSVTSSNVVVYSWNEIPGLDYEIDISLMPSNLIVTESSSSTYTVTGFNSPCQFAMLTVDVFHESINCGAISQTLPCRPSIDSNVQFGTSTLATSFSECVTHDLISIITLVNGVENPASGRWESVSTPQSSEGFIFNGSTLSFDPNGLEVGEYSANYNWTNPIDGCGSLFTYSLFVTACVPVDNDLDGVLSNTDCDDNDPNNYPGNTEVCDNRDNNCNGQIDEGLDFQTYFTDNDRDGFGDDVSAFEACITPPNVTTLGGDCDDFNDTVFPGATEIPDNGIDENCDGEDGSTSVNDLDGYKISVYPNPVKAYLQIETELNDLSFRIYNLQGSLVKHGQPIQSQIDLTDVAYGTYLLVLSNSKGAQVVDRIVKL